MLLGGGVVMPPRLVSSRTHILAGIGNNQADGGANADRDLVIIGGGVAGYVAAIKAGQEGMKVRTIGLQPGCQRGIADPRYHRLHVSRSAAPSAVPA